jgi:antitoxin YefM
MNYAVPIALAEANVRLGELCEKVIEDRDMILIHQPNGQDVALIAFEELNGLLETAHLLRSSKNADRLLNALQRARSGVEKTQSIDQLRKELGI